MKINVKNSSPDGMTITFETFLMTYTDLKYFIDWVALLESNQHKKLIDNLSKPLINTK